MSAWKRRRPRVPCARVLSLSLVGKESSATLGSDDPVVALHHLDGSRVRYAFILGGWRVVLKGCRDMID